MKKILFLLLCTVSIYGQTSTGQEQEFDYGIKNNSLQTITTPTYIGTFGTDGTQGKIPSAYIAKTAAVQDSLNKKLNLPTGFLQGLQLSINADPTKFNIAAGYYVVTDFTNLTQPVVKIINYAGATGLTPAYLATSNSTYVALDINGAVVSSASPFTDAQRRTLAIIGNVVHSNRTTINIVNEIKAPIVAVGNQLHDFMKAIGFLNESGNVYSANGANLQINKSVGDIFGMGINASDYLSPHKLTIPLQTALTFAYRFQNGTQLADTQNINPNIYDVGGTSTATPSNKWTIQRINLFQSGLSRIQPGQTVYNSFNDAVVALPTQPFVTEQNIADNAVFRCYLIVQQGTTNLASAVAGGTAQFVPVDKFGNIIGNGSVALTYSNIVAALGFTPANDVDVLHKTGNETKTGTLTINNPVGGGSYFTGTQSGSGDDRFLIKLFNNGSVNSAALRIDNQSDAYGINLVNSSTGIGSYIGNNSNGTGFKIDNSSMGVGLILNNGASATGYPFVIAKDNVVKSYINDSGDVNGVKFVKTGGTSSQFLKADGSIDSTVYAPSTGGTGYIQNQNASAQSANMWISGSGKFGTSLTSGGLISANLGYNGTLDFNYNNGITGGLSYYAGGTTLKFNVTNAGAATFASSVTVNKNLILNNSETLINGQVINSIKSNVAASSWAEINTYSIPRISDGQYFANAIRLGFLVPSDYQGNSSLFEAVSINQGGNVGIGVISPSAKLDVAGTFNATGAATFSSTVSAAPAVNSNEVVVKSQLDAVKPYKVYTALLSQSGTSAPTATVLENTLGGTVVWTRSNIGQYVGTLTGAFTDQKTIIFVNRSNPSATAFDTNMAANVININTVGYTTFSNSAYVDGQTNSASIEIRVYN